MPTLSRLLIRTALGYLALGFTLGALMLANKGLAFAPMLWRLRPVHIEVLLIGWMVQFIMGVGFWILPRWKNSRGNTVWVWWAFALLNLGIALVIATYLLPPRWSALSLLGRMAEMAGVLAYLKNVWPRVKPLGAQFS